MKKKIVIIDHEPYSTNKRQRYYISEFLDNDFCVEYWSVCNVLPYLRNVKYLNSDDAKIVRSFNTYTEFLDELSKLDRSSILILEVWARWSTLKLFVILKINKIKFIKIDYFYKLISVLYTEKSILSKLLTFDGPGKWIKLIFTYTSNIIFRILVKWLSLNKPEILFLTGKSSGINGNGSVIKSLTYFDVLKFEEIKNDSPMINYKYIVFLDIFLVGHPDLQRSNLETIDATLYYEKMNLFFDKIELSTGFKVVIAAHPQSNYQNCEYGQRDCYLNKTAELVNNCEFVLTHGSLSINFAVLSKKSIVYIYTNEFITANNYLKHMYKSIENATYIFKSLKINVDVFESINIEDVKFDENAYQAYLQDNLYSTEFPKPNYEILRDNIMSLSIKS